MVTERGGEQILLVDDNPTNLQVLFKTLEGSGYRLLAARDGESALKIARKAQPSLILLDVMMPGIDGFQVCETLKADPETQGIAIIFLSALTDSQSKVHGLAIGGVDYIAKPFQADEVLARVRTHIKIHRLERALASRNIELEDENFSILNAVEEGIIGLDADARITSINPQAAALCGWPAMDALGEPLLKLGLFKDDKYFSSDLKDLVDEAKPLRRREVMRLHSRPGAEVPVMLSGTPRNGGAVLVLRDVSEWLRNQQALHVARQELEAQRQHLAHIERLSTGGEMAAGIAHEVNQPLTAVVNYARVCQRMLSDGSPANIEKINEVLGKITIQAERASAVIQRMRSFVKKPVGGRAVLHLNKVLEEVLALAEVDARSHGVEVILQAAPDLPEIVADEVQLQQVALNLIRNAIESSTDKGDQRPVTVASFCHGDNVGFSVTDYGRGLQADIEAQLFTPFVSSKEGGMGIGLSVSQAIIQAHGGDIRHRPNPEGGAIFSCEFPAQGQA